MQQKIIIDFIKNIDLFIGMDEDELSALCGSIEESSFQAGTMLFEENGPRRDIFIIYKGQIELFKRTESGQEKRLATFTAGDFIGEGSLDDNTPHSTSARAVVKTKVLTLKKSYFARNGSQAVKIFSNIIRVVSRRMRYANYRIMNSAAQYESGRTRKEHDLLGERDVPYEYYYGIQTLRALENFNISGVTLNFYPRLIQALVLVKKAAAMANFNLGLLDKKLYKTIIHASDEII